MRRLLDNRSDGLISGLSIGNRQQILFLWESVEITRSLVLKLLTRSTDVIDY